MRMEALRELGCLKRSLRCILQLFQFLHGLAVAVLGSFLDPFFACRFILLHAVAFQVAHSQIILSNGGAFLRSLLLEFHRLANGFVTRTFSLGRIARRCGCPKNRSGCRGGRRHRRRSSLWRWLRRICPGRGGWRALLIRRRRGPGARGNPSGQAFRSVGLSENRRGIQDRSEEQSQNTKSYRFHR